MVTLAAFPIAMPSEVSTGHPFKAEEFLTSYMDSGKIPVLRRRTKQEVCEQYLMRLKQRGDISVDAPGFVDGVRKHFARLPTRYAYDISIDSLDVLSHKRLLDEARADPSTVSFAVRPVDVTVGPVSGSYMGEDQATLAGSPIEVLQYYPQQPCNV
jgi:hypothetical protein